MPITLGFWAHMNDLLGTGKQRSVIDGRWANSLQTFIKGALPFQKCLVKQVGITVFLNPDILDSYCLPFYLTYTGRADVPGPERSREEPRTRQGATQRWGVGSDKGKALSSGDLFILWFAKEKGSGADDSVHPRKVSSSFDLYSRRKEKK